MISASERAFLLIPKALPSGNHYQNLRKFLPRPAGDKLRKVVYKNANYCCELCGRAPARLEAHEVWTFHFATKEQILTNIVALCKACHGMQHTNLLKLMADRGQANLMAVVKHYNALTGARLTASAFIAAGQNEYLKYENATGAINISREMMALIDQAISPSAPKD